MNGLTDLRRAVLQNPADDGPRRARAARPGAGGGAPAGGFTQVIGELAPGEQAAALVAAHPITAGRLTDRHPEPSAGADGGVRWVAGPAGGGPLAGRAARRSGPGADVPPGLFAAGLQPTPFATVALAGLGPRG